MLLGGRARRLSIRAVAYGFDIVAVRIEHEGGVIGGVVLGPEPWRPVVSAPCRDRGMIENIDGGTAWSHEGDMQGAARLRALTDPEGWFAALEVFEPSRVTPKDTVCPGLGFL